MDSSYEYDRWLHQAGAAGEGLAEAVTLISRKVVAKVHCEPAFADVTETLSYKADKDCNVKLTLPLPPQSAVYRFQATLGEKVLHTEVMPKAEATADAQSAHQQGHAPAIMQQAQLGFDFSIELGNVPAGQACSLEFAYVRQLEYSGSSVEFTHAAAELHPYRSTGTGGQVTSGPSKAGCFPAYEVHVFSRAPIAAITSPNHGDALQDEGNECGAGSESVTGDGVRERIVTLQLSAKDPGKDFTLLVELDGPGPASRLFLQECQRAGRTKTVLQACFAAPLHPFPSSEAAADGGSHVEMAPIVKRELWLLLDCSYGMAGRAEAQARAAAEVFLRDLPCEEGTLLNIVLFGTSWRAWSPNVRAFTHHSAQEAAAWLRLCASSTMGDARINPPLGHIYTQPLLQGFTREIILISGARLTVCDEASLQLLLVHNSPSFVAANTTLHCLAIGQNANWRLLKGMAEFSGGLAQHVLSDADVAPKASFLKRGALSLDALRAPRLLPRSCLLRGAPAALPRRIYPGHPLMVLAEVLRAEEGATIGLEAERPDGSKEVLYLPLAEATHLPGEALAKLQANRYINGLLRDINLHTRLTSPGPSSVAVEKEAVRAALEEGLVTPRTAAVGVLLHADPLDPSKTENVEVLQQESQAKATPAWASQHQLGFNTSGLFGPTRPPGFPWSNQPPQGDFSFSNPRTMPFSFAPTPAFGPASETLFGGQPTPPAYGAAPPSSGGFGAAAPSGFGAAAAAPSFGGNATFGSSPQPLSTDAAVPGVEAATPTFGASPAGDFGASAVPGFWAGAAPTPPSTASLFGASAAPPSQGASSAAFGGEPTTAFGAAPSAAFGAEPSFGAAPTTGFGAAPRTGFDAASMTAFGAPPTTAPPTVFGVPSMLPFGSRLFGASGGAASGSASAHSLFGAPASAAFGASAPPSSASAASLFGASSLPAFGAAPAPGPSALSSSASAASLFGAAAGFGSAAAPGFGASAPPSSASAASLFGAASTPAGFGAAPALGFGASAVPRFGTSVSFLGASPSPAYGAAPTTAFGAAPSQAFGASAAPCSGAAAAFFGASASPAFGAAPSALSGTAPSPAFGASVAPRSGGAVAFFGPNSVPCFAPPQQGRGVSATTGFGNSAGGAEAASSTAASGSGPQGGFGEAQAAGVGTGGREKASVQAEDESAAGGEAAEETRGYGKAGTGAASIPEAREDVACTLCDLQTPEGFWRPSPQLMTALGLGHYVLGDNPSTLGLPCRPACLSRNAWATVAVLAFLRSHLPADLNAYAANVKGLKWLEANWPRAPIDEVEAARKLFWPGD